MSEGITKKQRSKIKVKGTKERLLAESIRSRFAVLGGVEMVGLKRETLNRPLKFGK
jgi:hypothetical protein